MNTLTLAAYVKNNEEVFSRLEVQRMLNVKNRQVWRRHLIAIGKDPNSVPCLTWKDVESLIALQQFLQAGNGVHSIAQFVQIYRAGLLQQMCARFNLNPQSKLEELKNAY